MRRQDQEIQEFQLLHGVPVLPQIHELLWDQLLPAKTQQLSLLPWHCAVMCHTNTPTDF